MLGDDAPELQPVLDSLDDPVCRTIITELDAPMTAQEVAEATEVPLSTTYRKLERLDESSLLATSTELRRDGHHRTLYHVDFEEVSLRLDTDREFDITVARPQRGPEDRLASMWSEMRRET